MDETAKQVLTFLGTAGGVAFLSLIGKGVKKLWTGAASRERVRTTSLVRRTEAAEKKTDEAQAETEAERKLRLKAEYHVALLQHQVILLGAKPVKNDQDEE
ncbi:hypothetical protein PBI_SHEPARD_33 [Arthrobacter phage Shepard]|nr:hypothetical protein PBI_SHEPARD_33 [Arthrobacter phage Shepard]UYL88228.1 hypothetical protein SEA_LILHUDDY_33 [Arthrobacter phage LilHuddy]